MPLENIELRLKIGTRFPIEKLFTDRENKKMKKKIIIKIQTKLHFARIQGNYYYFFFNNNTNCFVKRLKKIKTIY